MFIALINSPSLTSRPVSRSMAGGLGFDGNDSMLLPPLDLATMAATLRNSGETVAIIDADPLGLDANGVFARLAGRPWDLLIASVSLPTLDQDATFLADLRRRYPAARIAAKTFVRDHQVLKRLLTKSRADLVIHGEAELTVTDIAHARSKAGTAWFEAGFFHFDEGKRVGNLNDLPFPARDLLPNDRYTYPLLGRPVATLQTSRGCPYPCRYYCPYPLVEGRKWRSQTPGRIFAELREIVERQGITRIYFRDANFTLDQQRIANLCDLIVAARWHLEWVCETRADCLADPLLEKMRAAGCVGFLVGVETGDERVMHLREGKKGLTVNKLAHLREKARQLGMRIHFLLIVGLPQQTRESIVATYDLIQRYQPDTIGVTIITPYPGTPLYDEGIRKGWIESQRWRNYGGHQVSMHTPNLTRSDLIAGKRFLEQGFAIMHRRQTGAHSEPLEAMARQHHNELLRWAYPRREPLAVMREISPSANSSPRALPAVPSPRPAPLTRTVAAGHSTLPLSVVIPTHNRRAILRKTLLALASQTLASDQFEVIVADDGSFDDTLAMLRQFDAPFVLRAISQQHQGANAARNRAIAEARGEIVLVTGDDMVPAPALLEAHLEFHQAHPSEFDAMLGFIDWSPEITVTPFMRYLVAPEGGEQFSFHMVHNGRADFWLFYAGNISIKRALLMRQETVFNTAFAYPAFDDTELGYRLAQQGMQIHYNPHAVTFHHHAMTPQSFASRQRRAGQMAMVFVQAHPEIDQSMLGTADILRSPQAYSQEKLSQLLAALAELEKPATNVLSAIQVNGHRYDQFYAQKVLHPLYRALLHCTYALGVCEAGSRATQGGSARAMAAGEKPCVASIIIPVFNKLELTKQCLAGLAAATRDVEHEIIVVDNHSTDGTAEYLNSRDGDIQIIRNPDNFGFAKACNQAARAARGTYLVFLNNDTVPLDNWLRAMVSEVEEHSEVGIVGSKLLFPNGSIQHAGVVLDRLALAPYYLYRSFPGDHAAVNRRRELQVVTGACLLIRRGLFEKIGGFDEGFINGFEDVDLCLKARNEGWRVVYQPRSCLLHLESQTLGKNIHDAQNAGRLHERWGNRWWHGDEDSHYVADGYKLLRHEKDGIHRSTLQRLTGIEDAAAWAHVASTQIAALQQAWPEVRRELARPADWPQDPHVLLWAAKVCEQLGESELQAAFRRRLLEVGEVQSATLWPTKATSENGHASIPSASSALSPSQNSARAAPAAPSTPE